MVAPADPQPDLHPGHDALYEAFSNGDVKQLCAISPFAACLMPLLEVLGWQGDPRRVAESLPHFADSFDVEDLVGVLGTLNYQCLAIRVKRGNIDKRLLPCLLVSPDGVPTVVTLRNGQTFDAFDSTKGQPTGLRRKQLVGMAYFFAPAEEDESAEANDPSANPLRSVFRRFNGPLSQMLGMVWMNTLLAIALPLFILLLYDWVIPTGSVETLFFLTAGVLFVFLFDLVVRVGRTRQMAFIGGRLDNVMGNQAFQHLLHLPRSMSARSPIGSQLARMKQFETLRDFFTGPLAGVVFELPFVVIFLIAMIWIAGPVALIPVGLAILFVGAAFIIGPSMKRAAAEFSEARTQKQAFIIETVTYLRAIKSLGAEDTWLERCRELSARAAIAGFRSAQLTALVQSTAHTLMMGAGAAVLIYGASRVVANEMSVGALVASMALAWRMLGPLQMGFVSIFNVERLRQSAYQLNRLMRLKPERPPRRLATGYRTFRGEIAFQRVSMRYSQLGEPALVGVDFTASPGQMVAITGPSGAGKSTILKLVGGLYQAQAGAVLIDGIDIRQMDCAELRNVIAYVPQACHIFYGTIAQNLRLAEPMATDEALTEAIRDAGLLDDVLALPHGFNTRLSHELQPHLPSGFMQRLMLARAYVRNSTIYLFDEPTKTLDAEGEERFLRKLQKLRERATVIMVTHRPSHIQLADRVVYLQAGQSLLNGAPDEVLPRLTIG